MAPMRKGTMKWLVVHCRGHDYDIKVDNTAKYNFVSLLVDLYEEAPKQNVFPPVHPKIRYFTPKENVAVEVKDDDDLGQMFYTFRNSEDIDVYIEEGDVDTEFMVIAKEMIRTAAEMQRKRMEDIDEQMRKEREERDREVSEMERKQRELNEEMERKRAEEEEWEKSMFGEPVVEADPIASEIPVNVDGDVYYVMTDMNNSCPNVQATKTDPKPTNASTTTKPKTKPTNASPTTKPKPNPTNASPKTPKAQKTIPRKKLIPRRKTKGKQTTEKGQSECQSEPFSCQTQCSQTNPPETNTNIPPFTETQTETQPQPTEPTTQTDPITQPQSTTQTEPTTQTDPTTQPQSTPQTEPTNQTDPTTQPDPTTQTEPSSQTDQTPSQTDPTSQTDHTHSQTDPSSQTHHTNSQTDPTSQVENETPNDPFTQTENETTNDPTSQTAPSSQTQQTPSTQRTSTQTTQNKRRMPRTTARRRGVSMNANIPNSSHTTNDGFSMQRKRKAKEVAINSGFVFSEEEVESDEEEEDWMHSEDDDDLTDTDVSLISEDEIEYEEEGEYVQGREHDWVYEEDMEDPEYISRVYRNGEIYVDEGYPNIKVKSWLIFLDKQHFLSVLRDYCIQEGFDLVVLKNEKDRYTALCADPNCSWRIHASVLPDNVTWAIKTLTVVEHECERKDRNMMANINWLSDKLMEDIRSNHDVPIQALCDLIRERYTVTVPSSTMYKVRIRALKEIDGAHDESFAKLPAYIAYIQHTHPNAKAYISWLTEQEGPQPSLVFKRMFVSFDCQFNGLINGCRPLIGVDGCHLKGNYNGVLLSAVALDGNQEIFPVAYAIVSGENTDNWRYFFTCLESALRNCGTNDWTFISDRMKGVETALSEVFPMASRRVCARHLFKNFSGEFKGPHYEAYFWQAADAYNEYVFLKAMNNIRKLSVDAYQYLMTTADISLWARFRFRPQVCAPDNTNNFTESFNATLGLDRVKPMLTLAEGVRRSCMIRIAKRQLVAEEMAATDFTPFAKNKIKMRTVDSRFCKVFPSGQGIFEVREHQVTYPVDLRRRTCMCGVFQIDDIPCRHALRVIQHNRENPYAYCSTYYSGAKYKLCYAKNILPMLASEHWPAFDVPSILPPPVQRTVGRPPRNRKRQLGEQRKGKRAVTVKCSKCHQFGHNVLTCMGGMAKKEKRRAAAAAAKESEQNADPSTSQNTQSAPKKRGGRKPKKQQKLDAMAADED